jgi:hypothetical protein
MPPKQSLADHFQDLHNNPPPPFNPAFDPKAAGRYQSVSASMQEDNYYSTHTREECKAEWAKRYKELEAKK